MKITHWNICTKIAHWNIHTKITHWNLRSKITQWSMRTKIASKCVKRAVFGALISLTLVSRKILVVEKLWNFQCASKYLLFSLVMPWVLNICWYPFWKLFLNSYRHMQIQISENSYGRTFRHWFFHFFIIPFNHDLAHVCLYLYVKSIFWESRSSAAVFAIFRLWSIWSYEYDRS